MPACTSSFIPGLQGHVAVGDDELVELWHVLSTVPDPRDPRGVRHGFATILTLAIGAVLAGCCSVAAIAAWAGDLPSWVSHRVGVRRRPPRLSTFARALVAVDPDVLDAVLSAWLAARASAPGGMRALAVDGKTARGAHRSDGTQVHLVACLDHATGTVLGQVEVTSKGSEIAAFATVLDRVDLHGCVVTADALHTQTAHAHYLHRHGGHYVLTVKGNQPTLRARCAGLPWSQVGPGHVEHAAGHGRHEQRTIQGLASRTTVSTSRARIRTLRSPHGEVSWRTSKPARCGCSPSAAGRPGRSSRTSSPRPVVHQRHTGRKLSWCCAQCTGWPCRRRGSATTAAEGPASQCSARAAASG